MLRAYDHWYAFSITLCRSLCVKPSGCHMSVITGRGLGVGSAAPAERGRGERRAREPPTRAASRGRGRDPARRGRDVARAARVPPRRGENETRASQVDADRVARDDELDRVDLVHAAAAAARTTVLQRVDDHAVRGSVSRALYTVPSATRQHNAGSFAGLTPSEDLRARAQPRQTLSRPAHAADMSWNGNHHRGHRRGGWHDGRRRDGHRDGHHRDGYRDAKRSRRDDPPPAPAPPARTPEDEAAFQLKTLVLRIGDFHARKVAVEEEDNLEDNITGFAQAVNAKGEGAGLVKIPRSTSSACRCRGRSTRRSRGAQRRGPRARRAPGEQTSPRPERLEAGDGPRRSSCPFLAELATAASSRPPASGLCAQRALARVAATRARDDRRAQGLSVYLALACVSCCTANRPTTRPTSSPRSSTRAARTSRRARRRRPRRRLPRAQLPPAVERGRRGAAAYARLARALWGARADVVRAARALRIHSRSAVAPARRHAERRKHPPAVRGRARGPNRPLPDRTRARRV